MQRLNRLCKEIAKITSPKKDHFHWNTLQWLADHRLGRHKSPVTPCPKKEDHDGEVWKVPVNWENMTSQEVLAQLLAFLRWLKRNKNKEAERLLHAYCVETLLIERVPYSDVEITEDNNSQEIVRNTTDRVRKIKLIKEEKRKIYAANKRAKRQALKGKAAARSKSKKKLVKKKSVQPLVIQKGDLQGETKDEEKLRELFEKQK